MLNNRELASIIFGLVVLVWLLSRRDTRATLYRVLRALFQNKIIIVFLAMIFYVSLVVWLFQKIGFWKIRLAKDTIYWFLATVAMFVRDADKVTKDTYHLRKMLFDNLKLVSALAFVISLYTFSFWVEIFSIPFLLILVGLSVVAGSKKEYLPAKQVVDFVLGIYGIVLIIWAFFNILVNFQSFASLDNLRSFVLPFLLTAAFAPFMYFLVLYMVYEEFFVLLDIRLRRDQVLAKYAKRQVFVLCHANLGRLIRVTRDSRQDLARVKNKEAINSVLGKYKRSAPLDATKLKQWILRGLLLLLAVLIPIGIVFGYRLNWTGFGSYTTPQGEYQRAKTFWDWMELALIPIALAVIAYGFNEASRRRERNQAETQRKLENERIQNHQEEEALQAYLDRMQELLLEKDLLKALEGSTASQLAYTLTQLTLKRLSPSRKTTVLSFLVTSQLVQQHDGRGPTVSLAGADLEGIGAPLGIAFLDLVGADLHGANLQNVIFDVPNLQNADLRMATLEGAHLLKADFRGANLETAVLAGANLWGAICSEETILPNGRQWSGSDLTEFGATCVPPYSDKELEGMRSELLL